MKNVEGKEVPVDTPEAKKKFYDELMPPQRIDPSDKGHRYLQGKDTTITESLVPFCQINGIHSVLDIGADWGKYTVWLHDELKSPKTTAIEIGKRRADILRELLDSCGKKEIEVLCLDFETESDKVPGCYDLVFAQDLVEHFVDWEKGWNALLSKGRYVYALIPKGMSWHWSPDHLHVFSMDTVRRLVEMSGGEVWVRVVKHDDANAWFSILVRGKGTP